MRIDRLRLRSPDPAALAAFYRSAFDAAATGAGVALGDERIEISPCKRAKADVFAGNETGFQHFAIVVADIDAAYARLQGLSGWRPISLAGPERLPKASGGVAAFKFRDPDGHPLELLEFAASDIPALWTARFAEAPERLFAGIDHTGLSVRDAEASRAFYAERGFAAGRLQVNRGAEQARLDGFADADTQVRILPLSPRGRARPGLELLQYLQPASVARRARDDTAMATCIVIGQTENRIPATDLDGHRLAFA